VRGTPVALWFRGFNAEKNTNRGWNANGILFNPKPPLSVSFGKFDAIAFSITPVLP